MSKKYIADSFETTAGVDLVVEVALKAPIESPTFTGTVSGVTKTMVGLGNADNTSDVNKPISSAAATTFALKADLVAGLVPQNQLPSYVDDVLEFANLAGFPATGEIGKIYIALNTNKQYRWSGSIYIQITNGLIASTNDLAEGNTNLYFTVARVLATLLTGLSFASSALISASDTIVVALGKLQAQISLNNTKLLVLKVTVELDSSLTNFFYAPQPLRIASVTNINGTPTVTIKVNNVNYTLNALIATGALITLTSNVVGVVNLNGTYE